MSALFVYIPDELKEGDMYTAIIKGVRYLAHTFSKKEAQEIVFNHRDERGRIVDGVTRETLYMILINHIQVADERNPKYANKVQIRHLEKALESQRFAIRSKIADENGNIR